MKKIMKNHIWRENFNLHTGVSNFSNQFPSKKHQKSLIFIEKTSKIIDVYEKSMKNHIWHENFNLHTGVSNISNQFSSKNHQKSLIFITKSSKIIDFHMSLEPSRKFGLGDAITFGVAIFRASISARISPKNHRFWRAFSCNYLRRVDFFVVLFLVEFRQKSSIWVCFLMQLPSACRFFVVQFLLEFRRKFINVRFCLNSHEKSLILARFLMQLPSACWFFVLVFRFEFRWKIINFCVVFDAITCGVLIFSWFNFCTNFDEKSSILACFSMQLTSAC